MPTIVFVSPKGGAGKTTSALLLATQLAKKTEVCVIDADPNHPIQAWSSGGNCPSTMRVLSNVNEETIIDAIEAAAARVPFVVVDLEGTASKIVLMAASQADLVVIPTQGSQLDAEQANRAIRVVRQTEKMSSRKVPFGVLLTRTSPLIRTRTLSHISKNLLKAGIPVFDTEMHEREAFRAVFSYRQPLDALDSKEVSNLDKAVANAAAFASEIVDVLRGKRQVGQGRARLLESEVTA